MPQNPDIPPQQPMLTALFRRLATPTGLIALLGLTAGMALLLLQTGLSAKEAKAAALSLAAIAFWATGVLPEYLTALVFFLAAMLGAVAPADVVFSGFYSEALWLIFGGLVVGAAIKFTGLGERLANRFAGRFSNTYLGIVATLVAIGVVLGFLMPSSIGRVVLLIPIALVMADRLGFGPGSPGRTGLVMAAAFGSHLPTFAILPSNVPNMVMVGAAETLYHVTPRYGEYLLLHFPVLGLIKSLVIIALIVWLYPDRPRRHDQQPAGEPATPAQRILAVVLMTSLALWMTDSLHHISPAWVGLGAAVICLLPGIGLLPPRAINEQINYGSMFFVAGIMGLGAIVAWSGLGTLLAHYLLTLLPLQPDAPAGNFATLATVAAVVGTLTTLPGVPAVLTPLAGEMARASGLPVETVLMTQVLGFSTVLLPYQSAPLVVAMQLGGQSIREAAKMCLILAAVTILLLLPMDYVWWRLLGRL